LFVCLFVCLFVLCLFVVGNGGDGFDGGIVGAKRDVAKCGASTKKAGVLNINHAFFDQAKTRATRREALRLLRTLAFLPGEK
jgi:hypothetical protein